MVYITAFILCWSRNMYGINQVSNTYPSWS